MKQEKKTYETPSASIVELDSVSLMNEGSAPHIGWGDAKEGGDDFDTEDESEE